MKKYNTTRLLYYKKSLLIAFTLLIALFLNYHFFIPNSENKVEIQQEKLPPTLALTNVALGSLRGIIANILWWRIVEQQAEGNYFEIMQLAEWITTMQPLNEQVWAFQAYNMAYNVSYEFPDGETKWKWIYEAIQLLTHKGLKYNPNNQTLKDEIARIYMDKLSGTSVDVGNLYFRKKWTETIYPYLHVGNLKELKFLAASPKTLKELKRIKGMDILFKHAKKLHFDLLKGNDLYLAKTLKKIRISMKKYPINVFYLFGKIDGYRRRTGLKKVFNLDIDHMVYIDEQYGPFDWRLSEAYIVYWDATGSFEEYLKGDFNSKPFIRQALMLALENGRLIYDPKNGIFITSNNFRLLGRLHDFYETILDRGPNPVVLSQHDRFVKKGAALLYTFNRKKESRDMYHHYKEEHPDAPDYDTFIAQSLYKLLHNKTFRDKRALIESTLFQAYNWLASGDTQRAIGYSNFALLIWKRHQKKFKNNPARQLPPFDDLKKAAYWKVMKNPKISNYFKNNLRNGVSKKEFDDEKTSTYLGFGTYRKSKKKGNK